MKLRFLLVTVLGLLSACQSTVPPVPAWQATAQRDHPQLGVIEDLRSGQRLTPDELLSRLAGAPQVLVGEKHDNPDHHALQLWLLRGLADERAQGSLLLEMLNPDQQGKVEAVQQRLRQGERPENLPRQLGWQKNWSWSMYGPLVDYALQQPFPLLAAPAPALLFAGGFHVRKDLGIPLHLKDLAGDEPVVLMLAEAGETVGVEQADYVWYTAALPEQDYCAQLRR